MSSTGSSSGLSSTRGDMDILENIQQRPRGMIWGLEHLCYEERQRELGPISLEKRKLGSILWMCIITLKEGAKRTDTDSFQWCPGVGPEVTGTNGSTGCSLRMWGNTLNCEGDWLLSGTDQRGCESLSLEILQGTWTLSQRKGSGWPYLSYRVDQITSRDPFHPSTLREPVIILKLL